ncbi:hypothetical protein [uncultured Sphingomonas sp.]|uniref:hypothetical protein n=1 Tax=uncultured Sphingomonas sp. TaxID=158754 RepID=UPI0035CBDDF7
MAGLVAVAVFAGAMAMAVAAIWSTVAPEWHRIARLAVGQVEEPFRPLAALVRAERRIAVKRWAASPIPAPLSRLRATA